MLECVLLCKEVEEVGSLHVKIQPAGFGEDMGGMVENIRI